MGLRVANRFITHPYQVIKRQRMVGGSPESWGAATDHAQAMRLYSCKGLGKAPGLRKRGACRLAVHLPWLLKNLFSVPNRNLHLPIPLS